MGTGWRRAFCTSTHRVGEATEKQASPRSAPSAALLSGPASNPSTPRLQLSSPRLRCRTIDVAQPAAAAAEDSPRSLLSKIPSLKSARPPRSSSNTSSPHSPSTFSIFRTSLRLSKSTCGICLQSVKTRQGTAIFTAECSHAFHFPCIAAHVRKQSGGGGGLACPVCGFAWQDVPPLAIHKWPAATPGEEKRKRERRSAYDDDESLRFNPIPEADEAEGDDGKDGAGGEFLGFFVGRTPPSIPYEDPKKLELTILPDAAVISAGRSCESYVVLLSVRAPRTAGSASAAASSAPLLHPGRRAPIDLVTVLDLSPSMAGAKLEMLKRAMRLVVASLGSSDRLSIVAFCGTAKRLMPLRRMSTHGRRGALAAVDHLVCRDGNCVGDALRKATKVLEDRRERNPVASVMLLSAGCDAAAAGHNREPPHPPSLTRFTHLEIPVHESGFGSRSCREPAEDAFSKCVGGLLSVVAQDLRLQLSFPSGEVSAVYAPTERPEILGSGSLALGDLYAEEPRELLVELRVPASAAWAQHVLSVRSSYVDPTTLVVVRCKEQTLLVPRPHVSLPSDPKIERLRNLFVATKSVVEARRLAEHGDCLAAHQLLSSARSVLLQSSSASASYNLRAVEAELAELIAHWKKQQQLIQRRRMADPFVDDYNSALTPTSAWRAAEQLAKVAIMKESMNRVGDLHGFENARF